MICLGRILRMIRRGGIMLGRRYSPSQPPTPNSSMANKEQEMAVLSLLLTGQPLTTKVRQDTIDPTLDLALYSYLTRCTASYSALRCVLVSVELLRSRGGGAAEDAARWAIRALEINALGSIGHALVTERVSACYAVRKGVGSGAWGSRRRKTAMWNILAAKGWMELGKRGRARGCLEEAAPV